MNQTIVFGSFGTTLFLEVLHLSGQSLSFTVIPRDFDFLRVPRHTATAGFGGVGSNGASDTW